METMTNTPEQNEMAAQLIAGALESAARGDLFANGVAVKCVTRENAPRIFAPGCAEIVKRYLGAQTVAL